MVIKRTIPTWTVVLAVLLSLAAVVGFIMSINPSVDKDTLIKMRTKPNSVATASAATSGMPRGTPVIHALPGPAAGSRQKPTQG